MRGGVLVLDWMTKEEKEGKFGGRKKIFYGTTCGSNDEGKNQKNGKGRKIKSYLKGVGGFPSAWRADFSGLGRGKEANELRIDFGTRRRKCG